MCSKAANINNNMNTLIRYEHSPLRNPAGKHSPVADLKINLCSAIFLLENFSTTPKF